MKNSENKVILRIALRYFFHLAIFLLFLLTSFNWYSDFQNFAVHTFSRVKYVSAIGDSSDEFTSLIFFVILCYRTDFLILRRLNQKEFLIPLLLVSDIICLFITNLTVIIYNNWANKQLGWVEAKSLNNIPVAFLIIATKDWLVEAILKRRYHLSSIESPKSIENPL